jgi:hypothetical protein
MKISPALMSLPSKTPIAHHSLSYCGGHTCIRNGEKLRINQVYYYLLYVSLDKVWLIVTYALVAQV